MPDDASSAGADHVPESRVEEDALAGRKILLGVSGGIAAYKAALLVRLLKKAGAEVQVLMTPSAARFISPLTLGTLSGREVLTEIFPEGPGADSSAEESNGEGGGWTRHVSLGLWADLFVVAPATAQTVAKLAGGFCDSMLTATALSARCPLLVCPTMDRDMYTHPAVQRNLHTLESDGHAVMPAAEGELASGLSGQGRLPEPDAIVERIRTMLSGGGEKGAGEDSSSAGENTAALAGQHVLVTAGPTREHIDPVRHLTNPSTGTMGFALAEAAARRGARVTLVAGPTPLATPPAGPGRIQRIDVESAAEMHAAVQQRAARTDLVLMAAAVADYTPADPSDAKLKKTDDTLTLRLERTPDILAALGKEKRDGQRLLGFALETDDGPANARRKLDEKNLDWIVLNSPTEDGSGFGTGTNRVTLFGKDGTEESFPKMPKRVLAGALIDRITGVAEAPAAP